MHGTKTYKYSNARLAGFADGEFRLSVYLKSDGYTSLHVRRSQNRRNRHLVTGVQDFFGFGIGFTKAKPIRFGETNAKPLRSCQAFGLANGNIYGNLWQYAPLCSRLEWKSNGYKTNMGRVAEKLKLLPFQTAKSKEREFFLCRIDAYNKKVSHAEIGRLYGFTQNKEK